MPPVKYHAGILPPPNIDYMRLLKIANDARTALGRYDGILEGVQNPEILLSPMLAREAELSSRIEGTQATLQQVLEFEAGKIDGGSVRKADIQEIINYRIALDEAIANLKRLPLSNRLIRQAHQTLMQGVRGQHSNPGQFRNTQNWIGPDGCKEDEAVFLPPPANEICLRLGEWEKYMHQSQPDALIQMAILHAEFEAIHPFLDGNGRLGRMIVPLFLFEKNLISSPSFYISEELEKSRNEYYAQLQNVSANNDWNSWCEFFLKAVANQAGNNFNKAKAILTLYEDSKDKVAQATNSQYAIEALDYCFTKTIFSSSQFRKETKIPDQTAGVILRRLRNSDFLETLLEGSGQRPEIFYFPKLLEIVE